MKMTTRPLPISKKRLVHHVRAAALAGAFSLAVAAPGFAAFVPLPENEGEDPGIALGSGTAGVTGTVIAAQDSVFNVSIDFRGVLRSMVVDTGSGYDFYYQLVNTGTDDGFGTEIYRMKTSGGFTGLSLDVSYRSDLTGLNFAGFTNGPSGGSGAYSAGTKSVFSADRDNGSTGSVGFDFSSAHFIFDPAKNINGGETSRIEVVRTSAATFVPVTVAISGGFGTAQVAAYAPVPEPHAAAMIGAGCIILIRRRSRRW